MEIYVPGRAPNDSPAKRIAMVRDALDHLPAWRCDSLEKGRYYLCGRCFARRGTDPAKNGHEMWCAGTDRAGVFHHDIIPVNAICADCNQHAWPAD